MLIVWDDEEVRSYWRSSQDQMKPWKSPKKAEEWPDFGKEEKKRPYVQIIQFPEDEPEWKTDAEHVYANEHGYSLWYRWDGKKYSLREEYGVMDRWEAEKLADKLNNPTPKCSFDKAVMTAQPQNPERIKGILRQGHKMIITASSKAGKSMLLMELAICIAYKRPWLGFPCERGRVLYLNMEIDSNSCQNRFFKIGEAMGITKAEQQEHSDNIVLWNMRGKHRPLEELQHEIVYVVNQSRKEKGKPFDVIMLDPLYKVLEGDENAAGDIGNICNYMDTIATKTGCCFIFSHHHAKGFAGNKRIMDRGSGSGVFARDPDAILDVTELDLTDEARAHAKDENTTAWRLENVLREFPTKKSVNFWFEYPLHIVDRSGVLDKAELAGTTAANLAKSPKRTTPEQRRKNFDDAYNSLIHNLDDNTDSVKAVKISEMAAEAGFSKEWIRQRVLEYSDSYSYDKKNGLIWKKADENPFNK